MEGNLVTWVFILGEGGFLSFWKQIKGVLIKPTQPKFMECLEFTPRPDSFPSSSSALGTHCDWTMHFSLYLNILFVNLNQNNWSVRILHFILFGPLRIYLAGNKQHFLPRKIFCQVGSEWRLPSTAVREWCAPVTSLWYLRTPGGHYFSLSHKGLIYTLQVSTWDVKALFFNGQGLLNTVL